MTLSPPFFDSFLHLLLLVLLLVLLLLLLLLCLLLAVLPLACCKRWAAATCLLYAQRERAAV